MKATTRAAIGLSGLVVLAALALAVYSLQRSMSLHQRLDETATLNRKVLVSIESYFVDNCVDLYAGDGSVLPSELTTPVAYLATMPADPFDPRGGRLHFLSEKGANNAAFFLLASRGPDGDSDIQRLPWKESLPVALLAPKGTRMIVSKPPDGKLVEQVAQGYWIYGATKTGPQGSEIPVPTKDVIFLPRHVDQDWYVSPGFLDKGRVVGWLAENGVAWYDPTNGATSDGDILLPRGGLVQ